ncbi:hypothetical protein FS837_011310 [Tulasnella sp. UAMH 9824]|nr:hypothetical protein FS837_011310 [Tulasnella sp. UAMH 9824]
MSLLRLTSRTRSGARLKSVQQTFRPAPSLPVVHERTRRSFASTPQHSDADSSSSPSTSSLARSQPTSTSPPQSSSRDHQQTTVTQSPSSHPAPGPDPPRKTATAEEEASANGGGDEPFYTADNYIKPTLHVLNTFRKLLVYTSAASISIALLVFLGFEGTHLYVENVSIAPTPGLDYDDEYETGGGGGGKMGEDAIWGWAVESQESWTGGKRGGTDPALGYRARHLIRAAWMAQNWGAGVGGPQQLGGGRSGSNAKSDGSTFNVTAYTASAQFLSQAIALAKENPQIFFPASSTSSAAHDQLSDTALDLLGLRSRVLERIGTPGSITAARDDLLQIWDLALSKSLAANHSHHRRPIDAARVALKIGDLSYRLQEGQVAVGWWQKAIDYATLGAGVDDSSRPSSQSHHQHERAPSAPQLDSTALHVPSTLPPSPLAQRTLASALVSLSTYFAATQRLQEADTVQRSALRLLSLAPRVQSSSSDLSSSKDAAQPLVTRDNASAALHSLFLQHRASVLSVHHAQVLYAASTSAPAPKRSWMSSKSTGTSSDGVAAAQIQLHSAATAAEKVAHTLTGVSKSYADAPSALTHKLSSVYAGDKVLSRPAASLLRDARRTAAEAWNLSGMLYQLEGRKEDLGSALECFERAVHWSGGQTSADDPESQVIQKEWATYWKNYTSLKEKLSKA